MSNHSSSAAATKPAESRRFVGSGIKPSGVSRSVLHALHTLVADPSTTIYIPTGGYLRGGLKKSDAKVAHSPIGVSAAVTGYASHKSRFNFSLKTTADARVAAGGKPEKAALSRTFNIIRDGQLVLGSFYASMSEASFDELQAAGVIASDQAYQPNRSYVIELQGLSMVSPNWARPSSLGLVKLMVEQADLAARQTALNARLKQLGAAQVSGIDEHGIP